MLKTLGATNVIAGFRKRIMREYGFIWFLSKYDPLVDDGGDRRFTMRMIPSPIGGIFGLPNGIARNAYTAWEENMQGIMPIQRKLNPLARLRLSFKYRNSIVRKIARARGRLLPIGEEAFEERGCVHDHRIIERARSFIPVGEFDLRGYFEEMGFRILRECKDDLPGWYACKLPKGWTAKLDTDCYSRDEAMRYYDKNGVERIHITGHKDHTSHCDCMWLES